MSGFRNAFVILTFISILASTISSNADEDIENLIDIAESASKVTAIIEGIKTISVNLRPNEKVLWSSSNGNLGAFLTDARFFVISTSSGAWRVLRLKIDEPENAIAALSPYMALLVTEGRAIGYNSSSNRFFETRLPLYDEVLAVESGKSVAVVITSSRAFGLAAESSSFVEVRLGIKETIEKVTVTSSKATVRTSDRLLSFVANGSTWKDYRLD